MAQHIVAIDLGHATARVVTLEVSMRRAAVSAVQSIAFPTGLSVDEVWAHVKSELQIPINSLVIGLDARSSSTRQLHFPFHDLRRVEAAVMFELEGQIPYNLEDIATTWRISERQGQTTQVLAAIAPKNQVVQQLHAQSQAGLEPRVLMLPAAGLAEYMPSHAKEPVALASIGASQTQLAICQNGLRFARTLRLGGNDIDRALAQLLGQDLHQAKAFKETQAHILVGSAADTTEVQGANATPEQRVSQTILQALTPLIMGFVSTFKSLPPQEQPHRLILTGGSSRLAGLAPYLEHRLGIPVELLDITENIGGIPVHPAHLGPEYAVALGMALALHRHGGETPLNFRRGEFAYHGDLLFYRGQLTRAAVGTALVLTLALMASLVRYTLLRSEESEINQGFCAATKRITGTTICDPTIALATLKQSNTDGSVMIPSFSAGTVMEMLSQIITSNVDVQFDELDFSINALPGQPDRITGKGEAASFDTTEQLVSLLKREPCIEDAEISKQRKGQSAGRVEFNITIKLACPAGHKPGQRAQKSKQATL